MDEDNENDNTQKIEPDDTINSIGNTGTMNSMEEGYESHTLPYAEPSATVPSLSEFDYIAANQPVPRPTQPIGTRSDEPPAQRIRRSKLRNVLQLIAAVLLVAGAIGGYLYLTRSTPEKTLQSFCGALQQSNYHDAYSQLSTSLQHTTSEQAFAALFAQDKVTHCSYGPTSEYSSNTTTDLQLVHISQQKNSDLVTLVKDEANEWKIADVRRV